MPKIVAEFEVSEDFMNHLRRIQRKYGMKPQHFIDEAIYAYQVNDWSSVLSVTVDSLYKNVVFVIFLK